jgi:hypothetical protein
MAEFTSKVTTALTSMCFASASPFSQAITSGCKLTDNFGRVRCGLVFKLIPLSYVPHISAVVPQTQANAVHLAPSNKDGKKH